MGWSAGRSNNILFLQPHVENLPLKMPAQKDTELITEEVLARLQEALEEYQIAEKSKWRQICRRIDMGFHDDMPLLKAKLKGVHSNVMSGSSHQYIYMCVWFTGN
jgi:hypothetical protein